MKHFALAALAALLTFPVQAATSQQERMKVCNADAAKQELKGDARKVFMKDCLSAQKSDARQVNGTTKEAKGETRKVASQQQRMKTCSADAKANKLSADARKKFMKQCLSAD